MDFEQEALSELQFQHELLQSVASAQRDFEYCHYAQHAPRTKYQGRRQSRTTSPRLTRSSGSRDDNSDSGHRRGASDKDTACEDSSLDTVPLDPAVGPNHAQLELNKAKASKVLTFFVAHHNDHARSQEHIVRIHQGSITMRELCRKASLKFNVKAKVAFRRVYDAKGVELSQEDVLQLTTGARLFMSKRKHKAKPRLVASTK